MKKYWALILLLISPSLFADDWPEVEFPDTADVQVVADSMLYHGYPMKTWVMEDEQSQMMIASFFKKQWEEKSERFDAQMFNGDYVINSMQPPFLLTARIHQEYDRVITYVGVTKNVTDRQLEKNNQVQFPKPNGSTLISDIKSNDIFKQGRTLILSTPSSLASSYHFYRRHFQQRGWVENSAILDTQSGKAALQMSQGSNLVDISFNTKKSVVYIVANQVKEGL
ncbi:hypothetical protein [Shewanella woodyi]|uniref:hypothetical protein n=1 Tax=Shewanella woodyi TaxID=60961 RepID=UPI003748C3FA